MALAPKITKLAKLAVAGTAAIAPLALLARPSAAATPTNGVVDSFSRSLTGSWGTDELGGAWAATGLTAGSNISVDGVDGNVSVNKANGNVEVARTDVKVTDVDLAVAFATNKPATGWGQSSMITARRVADWTEYRTRTRIAADGTVALAATRADGTFSEIVLGSEVVVPGLTAAVGQNLQVHATVTGTNPTTIKARVWLAGTTEPTAWQVTATDSTAALQTAGGVGLRSYLSGSATNAPVVFGYDAFKATEIPKVVTPPPAPAAPPLPQFGAPVLGTTAYPVPTGALYVAPTGDDANAGTIASPFATIAAAYAAAPAGGTIVLRAGSYHEQLSLFQKTITIQNAANEVAWLDGSSVVTGWTKDGTAWKRSGWTNRLPRLDAASPMLTAPGIAEAAYPDQLFVDGTQARQVLSRSAVVPGTFFLDEATSDLYLGDDPTAKTVRMSDLQYAFNVNRSDNTVLKGFGVRRYGTPIARNAAVFTQSPGTTIADLVVTDNAASGVGIAAINSTVSRVTTTDNGQLGLHAHQADGLVISKLMTLRNNTASFSTKQSAGGLKLHATRGFTIKDSLIADNNGLGAWIDESSTGGTVTGNRSLRNVRSGFQLELSSRTTFANNVAADNGEWGIYVLESSDVKIWNNTLIRNLRAIQVMEGVRQQINAGDAGHDPRFGTDNPLIPWNVSNVMIRNNVFSGAKDASISLFGVDDSRKIASGWTLGVNSDFNAFYRGATATSPKWIANWGNWPVKMLVGTTMTDWRLLSGQDAHSVLAEATPSSPFVTNEAAGSYAAPAGSTTGTPLPSDIADALGKAAGSAAPMGVFA